MNERFFTIKIDSCLMKRPDYSSQFKAKAIDYIKRGKYKEALYYLKRLDPTDINVQTLKSSCLIATKKYDKAEKTLLKIIRKQPKDIEILRNLAIVYFYKGKFKKEIRYFERIIETTNQKKILEKISELTAFHGIEYYMKGKIDESEVLFSISLKADPKNEISLYNLGIISNDKGEPEKAITYIKKILSFNKKHFDALMTLGGIYFNKKLYEQARIYFKRAAKHAKSEDNKYEANMYTGKCYFNLKEYRKSEKSFMEAWAIKKDDSELFGLILITWQQIFKKHKQVGYAVRILEFLILKEDKSEAKRFLEHALTELPESKELKRFQEKMLPDDRTDSGNT
ncbi:MAG: tetratricopeptide repeat protein [Candidatus Hodarchaeales archaeon]|jgi:tetratricopeptide (TPR) repeat protein